MSRCRTPTIDNERIWTSRSLFLDSFNLGLISLTDPLVMCKSFIIRQMCHAMWRSKNNSIHFHAEMLKKNHVDVPITL